MKYYLAIKWKKCDTCNNMDKSQNNYSAWKKLNKNCIPYQFSSVPPSCLTFYDLMDCSTPGFPVHHQFPELAQTHVHWVGDAIQPSHPQLFPSPAFNFSQHQRLFQWVTSLHQLAKVLEFQLQHQSFQWIFGTDSFRMVWLDLLEVKGLSRVFSNTIVQKHQFFSTQFSL